MKNQRRKTPKTEKRGETRKKNQKMGVHRKKQGKHRTYNRAKETIQKKKKKKQGREREHTGKNEHKREPSFFPVSSQRNRGGHKEKATSRELEERERQSRREEDRKQRVKGTKSEEEGNDPKSFIASLLPCAQVSHFFPFVFFASFK
jgi:hypothetical protein